VGDKSGEQALAGGRFGGRCKTGPEAAGRVGEQGELRDDQNFAAALPDIEVHFAGRIGEHAVSDKPFGGPWQISVRIIPAETGKDQQAGADLSDNPAIDFDRRLADPLQQEQHGRAW